MKEELTISVNALENLRQSWLDSQVVLHGQNCDIDLAEHLGNVLTALRTATVSGWVPAEEEALTSTNAEWQGPSPNLWLYTAEFGVEKGFYNTWTKLWVAYVGFPDQRATRQNVTHYLLIAPAPLAPRP